LVLDEADADAVGGLGVTPVVTRTLMATAEARSALAEVVLESAR
jgi:hypothetical protein